MTPTSTDCECGRKAWARGMCGTCYQRWRAAQGGNLRLPLEQRFWAKVNKAGPEALGGLGPCWTWEGHTSKGYGKFRRDGKFPLAHVVAYEMVVGPVPLGLQLDHLCHSADLSCWAGGDCPHRRCVNPAHLEPVTASVNKLRGRNHHSASTACPAGHPYDEANTYHWQGKTWRQCRVCHAENEKRRRRRGKEP